MDPPEVLHVYNAVINKGTGALSDKDLYAAIERWRGACKAYTARVNGRRRARDTVSRVGILVLLVGAAMYAWENGRDMVLSGDVLQGLIFCLMLAVFFAAMAVMAEAPKVLFNPEIRRLVDKRSVVCSDIFRHSVSLYEPPGGLAGFIRSTINIFVTVKTLIEAGIHVAKTSNPLEDFVNSNKSGDSSDGDGTATEQTTLEEESSKILNDGLLNVVSTANLAAMETFMGNVREFSGVDMYRPLEAADRDAALTDVIVPGLFAARNTRRSPQASRDDECSRDCETTVADIRALLDEGREPTKAAVDLAWERCPGAMRDLCASPNLPASAHCSLQCGAPAARGAAEVAVYDVSDFVPVMTGGAWKKTDEGGANRDEVVEKLKAVASAEGGGEGVPSAAFLLESGGEDVPKVYHLYARRPDASPFERRPGVRGVLAVYDEENAGVAPPEGDAGLAGMDIAASVNGLYGGVDIADRLDEVYDMLRERDGKFEANRDWYRAALNSVVNNLDPPKDDPESVMVLDVLGATKRLEKMTTSEFHRVFTVGSAKMLAAVQIRYERDRPASLRAEEDIGGNLAERIGLIRASVALLVISALWALFASLAGSPAFAGRIGEKFPTAVFIACAAGAMTLSVEHVLARNAARAVHNLSVSSDNTLKLRDKLVEFNAFINSISGTATPDDKDKDHKTYKEYLHWDRSDFATGLEEQKTMNEYLDDRARNRLFALCKEVVVLFDRCNSARRGATMPFPTADLVIYTVMLTAVVVGARYLYRAAGVKNLMQKNVMVRRLLPRARMDPGYTGDAPALAGIVACEDAGISSAYNMFRWSGVGVSILSVMVFAMLLRSSQNEFGDALSMIKVKSRCVH